MAGKRRFVIDDDRTVQVPIVVYSGLPKGRVELVAVGPDLLFIQKPGTPAEVLQAVRSLLGGH